MKLKEQKIMNDPIMNCKRDVVECECLCAVTAGEPQESMDERAVM